VVHAIDDHVVVFDPPDDSGAARSTVGASNKRARDVRFVFDRVYGEDATQRDVYEGTTRGLLDAVLGGYNATVFAYGATGCGKTYTISGGGGEAGVVGLAMQELYARIGASDGADVDVAVSYLEVYNETIRDLLAADTGRALALREDARQGVTVAGLSEHAPRGVDAVLALMARGNANRTMSATAANAVSSRSHAVLQVRVRQRARGGGLRTAETQATLSIIDLAGSERAAVARGSGARMREGANINRSLLALANCINALCAPTPRHVPYRDSKLTRLLKFSLGGNCRTVMITCVSPASTFFEETHSTLKYASRAKRIRTTVARNTKSAAAHVAQYQAIIRAQKAEIQRLTRIVEESRAGPVRAVVAPHDDHDALRRRRAVVAAQNKLSAAYAPVLAARCDHASARVVGQWYAHHAAALRAWRAQFEIAVHAPSSDSSSEPDPSSDEFRRQADDLLRDLARARATASRAAEHAAHAVERRLFEAARAAQLPPAARLSKEDAQAVAREHLVLDLSASARGLARHADLADLVAADLAAQNALLLRLSAACLASLKRAQRAVPAEPARLLDSVYLQAIASFSDVTAAMRASMLRVQAAGGPANLPVPEPKPIQSPYVSR
ncbi:tubulin-dependent ATPase kip3, partial [Coemansia sp. RSA 2708]